MYRAVKVVRREDFEYERTFEREFEGIQRYEKVSQNHPGLVDVLHVGRDDQAGFYYYVMELADSETGEAVEECLERYRPRTLSSDLRRRTALTVRECVDLGVAIGGALGHLHQAGLTHRDVKPSNIIFVKGQPKLADVGLVASTGQRTFVGTEGYVPPEGPGTSSADLYSLAMVLYEMHTGKDRLDFPELPTNLEIPPSVNRDEWRALNAVICRAGSPDPRKRYDSAHSLVRALETVCASSWKSPAPKRSVLPTLFATVAVLGLLAIVGATAWWLWQDQQRFFSQHSELLSDAGSKGVDGSGLRTPVGKMEPIGKSGDTESTTGKEKAEKAKASREGDPSKTASSSENASISPPAEESSQKSSSATAPDDKEDAKKEDAKGTASTPPTEGSTGSPQTTESSAKEKAPDSAMDKGTDAAMNQGTETVTSGKGGESKPLVAKEVRGQLKITSDPPGARVYRDGVEIGVTETRLLDFELGKVELLLKREGYRDSVQVVEVKEGTQIVHATLLPDRGPQPGSPWTNSLGMEFLPAPLDRHRSSGEVTVALFEQFIAETGLEIPWSGLQGIAHVPQDRPLWQFCDWLTKLDRRAGSLGPRDYYRPIRDEVNLLSKAFSLEIAHEFGTLVLNSEPSGAEVWSGGQRVGETPHVLNDLRLGPFEVELYKPGHQVAVAEGELTSTDEPLGLVVPLTPDDSVVFGQPWTNSQNMAMVPIGNLLVATTETPARAFLEYLANQGVSLDPGSASAGLEYPASGVDHAAAMAFCDWLTRRERKLGRIRPWQRYRLPTDLEWSRFAGLKNETGTTPEERNQQGNPQFLWGSEWPPPVGSGNFADVSAQRYLGGKVIEGYDDGFETTAPVARFAPAPNGLYDLAGNVWEWVLEPYSDGSDGLHVVRGGGWNSAEREVLATSYRNPVPATARETFYGFRYVLEDEGSD